MRIIIAGGSGLIGTALTSELIDNGDDVIILSRNPDKAIGIKEGVSVLQWDGKTIQNWAEEIENTDVIINLTGENLSGAGFLPSRWTKDRKERIRKSRLDSGDVLVKAIEISPRKPSVFIQASGISYYGTDRKEEFSEESGPGNDFLSNLSIEWEASSEKVESMGIRRLVLRNGIVLSTKSGALPRLLLPYRLFVGGPLGNGRQIYSWIHLDDVVKVIRFLIQDNKALGIYNLTSPNPVTNNEFGKTISRVMKRPHYFPIPSVLMNLAFGEVSSVVLSGQRVIPAKLLKEGYVFKFPMLSDAIFDLLRNRK